MKWYVENISPQIREFVEGALAFVAPALLEYVANTMGAGSAIEPKTLLLLCVSSLLTYIRTRPTKN